VITSARTGEGMEEWLDVLASKRQTNLVVNRSEIIRLPELVE
jgi:ABC-type Zn uptake system ZnuABC Zn-binding protein ZnuA